MTVTILIMNIQFLIFDLDGTAVPNDPNGMPSQRVIEAVQKAQKKIKVGVATGRDLSMCQKILDALAIQETSILAGGTQLYNPKTKEIVWEQKLSVSQLQAVLSACSKFPYQLEAANEEKGALLRDYNNISDKSILYIVNVPNGEEQALFKALESVSDIAVHAVVAWKPNCHDIHISHKKATKEHALRVLLERADISLDSVMVVGDGGNDLPLFANAGLKVAMGNASPQLKAAANVVVSSVDADGLAEAIERFILS